MKLSDMISAETRSGNGAASRQILMDALATVSGLSVTSAVPDVAVAGAAWVRWIITRYRGHLDVPDQHSWDVYVVLPGDYLAATVDEGDSFRDVVAPVLARVGTIESSEPIAITFQDRQTMPGLRFHVTTR